MAKIQLKKVVYIGTYVVLGVVYFLYCGYLSLILLLVSAATLGDKQVSPIRAYITFSPSIVPLLFAVIIGVTYGLLQKKGRIKLDNISKLLVYIILYPLTFAIFYGCVHIIDVLP